MKLLLGINTLTNVDNRIYRNHMELMFNIGKWANETSSQVLFVAPNRLGVDNMRNTCAALALKTESDFILFIDDDVIVPSNSLGELLSTIDKYNADIVAGLTFIRGYPFKPMWFKLGSNKDEDLKIDNYNSYKEEVDENGIVRCAAVGFSCALLRVSTIKEVTKPYFMTGTHNTEDVYYCCKLWDELKYLGRNPVILGTTKVQTGHLLEPDSIREDNLEEIKKRFEKNLPSEILLGDRGDVYNTTIEAELEKLVEKIPEVIQ